MRTRATSFAFVLLLLAASSARAAQEPTWVDQVRIQVGKAVKTFGREVGSWMTAVRGGIGQARKGVRKGYRDLVEAGQEGMAELRQGAQFAFAKTSKGARTVVDTVVAVAGPVGTAPTRPRAVATGKLESPILDPLFLRTQDIVLAWNLGTEGGAFRRSMVLEDRLLIENAAHDLYSFEPRNGIVQWAFPLPEASQCPYEPREDLIFVTASDTLYELDRQVGRPRSKFVFPTPVASEASFIDNLVVVASWDRRVYAFNRENRVREWTFLPPDIALAGIVLAPNMAYIADIGGKLTAYSPPDRRTVWTYQVDDAIRVPILMYDNHIIFPAEDLYVHCVNRFGGFRAWKFPLRGFVKDQPWVTDQRVYFSAEGDAFYAVTREESDLVWKVPNGGWPVAVGQQNIYIQGPDREIWCIDRQTGAKQWAVSAKPFTYFVRNTRSDRIYLGTDRGELYALYLRGDHLEPEAEKPEGPPPPPGGEQAPPLEPEPGAAAPPARAPATAEEASPTAVFQAMVQAARADDKEAMNAHFDAKTRAALAEMEKLVQANPQARGGLEISSQFKDAQIDYGAETVAGQKAFLEVTVDGKAETINFVKEAGAWKISVPEVQMAVEMMKGMEGGAP
ncbi:MAG: PQQ-binding-like beta-propeller repeat protein [Candidatus Brocadiia bacterium]